MAKPHKPSRYWLGKKRSKETRRKISLARRGMKLSEEHKKKLSETHKRLGTRPPPAKKGVPLSMETKRKMSLAQLGKKHPHKGHKQTEATKEKLRQAKTGLKHTEKSRRKMSEAKRGAKSYQWKGGIKSLQKRLRNSYKYKDWQQAVFVRDDFTCQKCGKRGGDLHAHHKVTFTKLTLEAKKCLPLFDWHEACFSYSPLWDTQNGLTLCVKCHRKLHKGGK